VTLVELNPMEMRMARAIGNARQDRRDAAGNRNAKGNTSRGAADHIVGVMGELAFAKVANRYPSGLFLDKDEDDDVGGIQVRTRRKHYMDLYLWKTDPTDAFYALMTGEGPRFNFQGFIHGSKAAVPEYWTKGKVGGFPRVDCFVIPHSALSKLGILPVGLPS